MSYVSAPPTIPPLPLDIATQGPFKPGTAISTDPRFGQSPSLSNLPSISESSMGRPSMIPGIPVIPGPPIIVSPPVMQGPPAVPPPPTEAEMPPIEIECTKIGPAETIEFGKHTLFKHNPTGTILVMKENRVDTLGDVQIIAEQYSRRQGIVHRNLANLVEYKIDQELKLPMPDYVIRGYYENYQKNLRHIKELRKQSKVKFRQRELIGFAYEMVVFM